VLDRPLEPDQYASIRYSTWLVDAGALASVEFWTMIVVGVALLIAAAVTDTGADGQGFGAQDAWRYVTYLGIAYILSRGLTKFGNRHEKEDDK
jgi:hypothetical protein